MLVGHFQIWWDLSIGDFEQALNGFGVSTFLKFEPFERERELEWNSIDIISCGYLFSYPSRRKNLANNIF